MSHLAIRFFYANLTGKKIWEIFEIFDMAAYLSSGALDLGVLRDHARESLLQCLDTAGTMQKARLQCFFLFHISFGGFN